MPNTALISTLTLKAALNNALTSSATQWVAPSPLWQNHKQSSDQDLRKPTLLRFKSDNFMEELVALLANDVDRLKDFIASQETAEPPNSNTLLKLFQPIHGQFHLVAANLVERKSNLPQKNVDIRKGEKVGFVLRRLDPTTNAEMAWVKSSNGNAWQAINSTEQLIQGEELLPMFPLSYCYAGQERCLWLGLVPTSSHESFKAAGSFSLLPTSEESENEADQRLREVEEKVLNPLKAFSTLVGDPIDETTQAAEIEASIFVLLDFAEWLEKTEAMQTTWQAILQNKRPTSKAELFDILKDENNPVSKSGSDTWFTALKKVWDKKENIDLGEINDIGFEYNLRYSPMRTSSNRSRLINELKKQLGPKPKEPFVPDLPPTPKLEGGSRNTPEFLVRCVYQRPQCKVGSPELLSEASENFTIASFFDFEAPARPINISLPLDTSIAGLRKFKKNVNFIMSNKLRKQMDSIKDAKKALDGELSQGSDFNLGFICSISIPIITLCAFIVLFLFIILFNIMFWWLPFIKICFPIPVRSK